MDVGESGASGSAAEDDDPASPSDDSSEDCSRRGDVASGDSVTSVTGGFFAGGVFADDVADESNEPCDAIVWDVAGVFTDMLSEVDADFEAADVRGDKTGGDFTGGLETPVEAVAVFAAGEVVSDCV